VTGWHALKGPATSDGGELEAYTRPSETVLESPAIASCPVRLQAYWQLAAPASLDLQLLIASQRLVAKATVHTETRVPAEQVLVLFERTGDGRFEDARRMASPRSSGITFLRRTAGDDDLSRVGPKVESRRVAFGTVLLVYRLADRSASYVEMARAQDVDQLTIFWDKGERAGAAAARRVREMRTHVRFFGSDLEKGVILRSRMRAALLPRQDDLEQAGALYDRFLAEPPPLAV
jgi:hypothetical protein